MRIFLPQLGQLAADGNSGSGLLIYFISGSGKQRCTLIMREIQCGNLRCFAPRTRGTSAPTLNQPLLKIPALSRVAHQCKGGTVGIVRFGVPCEPTQ